MEIPQLMLTPPRQCRMLQEKSVHKLLPPRTRRTRVRQTHLEASAHGVCQSLRFAPLALQEHPDFKQENNPFHHRTRQGLSKQANLKKQIIHH